MNKLNLHIFPPLFLQGGEGETFFPKPEANKVHPKRKMTESSLVSLIHSAACWHFLKQPGSSEPTVVHTRWTSSVHSVSLSVFLKSLIVASFSYTFKEYNMACKMPPHFSNREKPPSNTLVFWNTVLSLYASSNWKHCNYATWRWTWRDKIR